MTSIPQDSQYSSGYMSPNCCRSYRIVVALKRQTVDGSRRRRSLPSQCEESSLSSYYLAMEYELTCYVAAEIDSSLVKKSGYKFILGDNQNYGRFTNIEPDAQVSSVTIGVRWSYVSLGMTCD